MIFTFLDTETTGLDPKKHEIIEFGALSAKRNLDGSMEIIKTVEFKVAPQRIDLADPYALKVNGYSEEAWLNSVPLTEKHNVILDLLADADYLVGQNLIFDLRFIHNSFLSAGVLPPVFPQYYDTHQMGKTLLQEGKLKSSSLDGMCAHFDIKSNGRAHTALVDVKRTYELFNKLSKMTNMQLYTYRNPHDPYKDKKPTK